MGFNGDDRPLAETLLSLPSDLYLDPWGHLIVAENGRSGQRLRILRTAP